LQAKTVAHVGGHDDDVNAVAYAERQVPNMIFSGSDDTFVKVGGWVGGWAGCGWVGGWVGGPFCMAGWHGVFGFAVGSWYGVGPPPG
jgi:hypothetical protein